MCSFKAACVFQHTCITQALWYLMLGLTAWQRVRYICLHTFRTVKTVNENMTFRGGFQEMWIQLFYYKTLHQLSCTFTVGLKFHWVFFRSIILSIPGWAYIKNRLFQITNLMHNSFIFQQYVCYTTILNMFRAARCSSSGGQIVCWTPKTVYNILFQITNLT